MIESGTVFLSNPELKQLPESMQAHLQREAEKFLDLSDYRFKSDVNDKAYRVRVKVEIEEA